MRLNPNASIEELRNAAIEITQAVLDEYGDAASSLACSLFDNVMELEGVNVPSAQVYTGVRAGAIEGTVHRVVGTVDGTAESLSAFLSAIETLAERETQLAAGMTIETNVERANKTKAGKHVRYARIPTGLDPCPWCAMLASRGFVYKSAEDAAAGSHHHCSCTIMPGVQGETKIDGYEPDYYRTIWKDSDLTITGSSAYRTSDTNPFVQAQKTSLTNSYIMAFENAVDIQEVQALIDRINANDISSFSETQRKGLQNAITRARIRITGN